MGDAMNISEGCTKRGRPPRGTEELRRQQLVKAAENLFISQGFAACMGDVAKAAGMSKKTIYAFFETKEDLFAAVIRAHMEENRIPVLAEDIADGTGMEEELTRYLRELGRAILQPGPIAFFRLTLAEADRFPELAHTFYREGANRHLTILAAWLTRQAERGLLEIGDPMETAAMLTSYAILEPMRRVGLGISELPSPAAIDSRARMAAHIFMRGCLRAHPGA
jgi:AcrR family transcriptional regulator